MEAETEKELTRPEEENSRTEAPAADTPELRAEAAPEETGAEQTGQKREKKPKAADPQKKARRSRGWKIALLVFLALVLAASAVVLTLDGRQVQFRMVDSSEMTIPYGGTYTEPGRSAVTAGRLFGVGKYQLPVQVRGSVDTETIGTYELDYTAHFLLRNYVCRRVVHVVDMDPPVITLKSKEDYEPDWFTGYEEEGFEAWDQVDGDLTEQVEREDLGGQIEYRVKDAAGNAAVVVREIPAVAPPELTLIGGEELSVEASVDFEDPGFTALSGSGEDLSEYVKVEGEVVPYLAGEYELVYTIENQAGETVSVTRTVTITPREVPATVQPDERTIYLTFDDGPGPYTDRLLSVLAAYNVKATFFITGQYPDYEDMIAKEFAAGHSVGIHSVLHDYYAIYASEQDFYDDFYATQAIIYRQTGEYSRLCRFPGGSSNTVSRFNPGIMSRLTVSVRNLGYQYFDWDVDSGDMGGTKTTAGVVENVIDGCTGRKSTIVLQHDVKDYSVAAVEQIILWGLRNGYTFRALDLTSPPAHHPVNN